jgi:hypothetical protein
LVLIYVGVHDCLMMANVIQTLMCPMASNLTIYV